MRDGRARVVAIGSGLLLAGGFTLASIGSAGAAPTSQSFAFTGSPGSFTVPVGVCQITVDAFGARAGAGFIADASAGATSAPGRPGGPIAAQAVASGGLGGHESATVVSVTPGESLSVVVGGAGNGANGGTGGTGGFGAFSGGNGGGHSTIGGQSGGGGGGGASAVLRGTTPLVVAGGGGGAAGFNLAGSGGSGGGTGTNGANSSGSNATGGASGTNGGGGGGGGSNTVNGDNQSGGTGGTGASALDSGGGGGGGVTGGGGGGGNTVESSSGGGGGGGGSGTGPAGATFENGVRAGNGVVTMTFDPANGGCATAAVITPRFTG
jgi:hypothetical protein